MLNKGIKNELVFANYLNGKKYSELNILMKDLFKELYPFIKEDNMISAWRDESYNKADIIVDVKGRKKVSKFENIIKYLEFHYGDGSRNGTGTNRIGVMEYKETHQEDIDEINNILKSKKLVDKCIDRFVLRGWAKGDKQIDALIYGMVNDFFYSTI